MTIVVPAVVHVQDPRNKLIYKHLNVTQPPSVEYIVAFRLFQNILSIHIFLFF
jgi:hypothetical protein